MSASDRGRGGSGLAGIVALLTALLAGVAVFLPFAFETSPLDAVLLRVPENQGNWWHALIGAPFFLAFPMIWLRWRTTFTDRPCTVRQQRILSVVSAASACGTAAVEVPFLLHLAGTSEWQRFTVLGAGLGIIVASGALLPLLRRRLASTDACAAPLNAAYLANALLCLIVYSDAPGSVSSRSGWFLGLLLVSAMTLELIRIFGGALSRPLPSASGSSTN
jgi:hypothetical protein